MNRWLAAIRADTRAVPLAQKVRAARPADGVEHAVRDPLQVPALESRVVVDADAGQACDLFATQPGDAAPCAEGLDTGLLGGDACSAGGEELADLGSDVTADVAVLVWLSHDLDFTAG